MTDEDNDVFVLKAVFQILSKTIYEGAVEE